MATPCNHFVFEGGHELVKVGLCGESEVDPNAQVANSFVVGDPFQSYFLPPFPISLFFASLDGSGFS